MLALSKLTAQFRYSTSGPSTLPPEETAQELSPKAGDPLAARARALRGGLARYFGSRGVPASDVEDLVQDVFLRVVRSANAEEVASLEAYCISTARTVFADWLKSLSKDRRRDHVELQPERHGVDEIAPDRILEGREGVRSTTLALMQLPERQRHVFILRKIDGMSLGEIAVRLRVSISTVEKDLQLAFRHVLLSKGAIQ